MRLALLRVGRSVIAWLLRPAAGEHTVRFYPEAEGWTATCNCRTDDVWYSWGTTQQEIAAEVHLHLLPVTERADKVMWA